MWVLAVLLLSCDDCDNTDKYRYNLNTHKLGITTLDTTAIYNGIFQHENIVIHVVQNLVNLAASTFVWAVIATFYQVNLV